MDSDTALRLDGRITDLEIPDHARQAFKVWVKTQQRKPHHHESKDWWQGHYSMGDAMEETCDDLVTEALSEVFEGERERAKAAKSLQVPGFGLPLAHMPKDVQPFPVLIGFEDWDWKASTLLIREVCMFKFIEELTNKNEWYTKVENPTITQKWKNEALAIDWTTYRPHADFTPAMADACISEVQKKAQFYKKTGLIPIFDYSSCVIKSDCLIPEELRLALQLGVRSLEDVPEADKDWHPGTTHKVLDLVHPSMWPFVYGRTPVLLDKRIGVQDALDHCGVGSVFPKPSPLERIAPEHRENIHETPCVPALSNQFQWLPCDVVLDGRSAKIDSYINNLHPVDHAGLYPVIERFIESSLPAWDLTYRWPTEFKTQRLKTLDANATCSTPNICRWECQPRNRPREDNEPVDENAPYQEGYNDSERGKRDMAWYKRTHSINLPDPVPGDSHHFPLSPSDVKSEGFFNGASQIQVIVKLANVQLTPEDPEYKFEVSKELADFYTNSAPGNMDIDSDSDFFEPTQSEGSPSNSDVSTPDRAPLSVTLSDYHSVYVDNDPSEYEGGSWHTEGMLNERICATALFYYDSENVTDCHLDFRTPSNAENLSTALGYGQSQHVPISQTFAIPNVYRDSLQYIGGVLTTNSPSTGENDTRAVFFPNLLQHRVSPFRLADPTRPGHRKILALFLVDPAVSILSTANVPPQQPWTDRQTNIEKSLAKRLPAELERMVHDNLEGRAIDLEEAKKIRLELMEERSTKQDETESNITLLDQWNFCEH